MSFLATLFGRAERTAGDSITESPAICPSCSHELDAFPKARRKCPACGEWIYRRRGGNSAKSINLVTEQAARESDAEREKGRAMRSAERQQEMRRKRDRQWTELNRRLQKAMKSGDFLEMSAIYREQTLQLFKEGKDHFRLAQEAQRSRLRAWLKGGMVERVQIIGTADSCPACRALEGQTFLVAEALEQMPIPPEDCTGRVKKSGQRGWCRCCYGAAFD